MTTEPDAVAEESREGEPPMFDLRLFVARQSRRSVRALDYLRRVCDEHLAGRHRVEDTPGCSSLFRYDHRV